MSVYACGVHGGRDASNQNRIALLQRDGDGFSPGEGGFGEKQLAQDGYALAMLRLNLHTYTYTHTQAHTHTHTHTHTHKYSVQGCERESQQNKDNQNKITHKARSRCLYVMGERAECV